MPFLDVSDVLCDPDLCDTSLRVTRSRVVVDKQGFSSRQTEEYPFTGIVTVDRSYEAKMLESGQMISGAILVVTDEKLTAGQKGRGGDRVTYQGNDYLVKMVDPYTAYGHGFVQAHCELLSPDGGDPLD
ncbi:head-tail adaptor [Salmonella enterica]|uniref:Head-tail adaptor n=3 Tax=Salmonella enterica TaxID=28901 RepID=A0A6Y5LEY9_SALDZ|nr:head-tail adaptor [Salmonella enterica subsp. enterica serovar Rubislaw]EAB1499780.1 head-tail adaptor [Salmonella enterica]EAB6208842.1 head-tail adaptor [Salmonella enterica subsp. enterica serovar Agbeni]EBF6639522.1 head-tail adaptor [Salmonella enterica subsp. enterica serovar Reading]EBQ4756013.1 head-tail adaptor [Salmonella enterica subsp. diarizonae]EBS2731459.1 head-tail adaptor [Salmonella enterica subsp. enterica serovar Cotham]EBW6386695.1 head-tail adaptor [Salmonella enteric